MMDANIKSICAISKTNTIWYASYISIKLIKKYTLLKLIYSIYHHFDMQSILKIAHEIFYIPILCEVFRLW